MKKNVKRNELQTRREFFKKAAKSALPILGVIVLASNPTIVSATELATGCAGNSCYMQCDGGCRQTCSGSCKYHCQTTCKGGCGSTCRGTCQYSSKGY